AMQLCTMDNEIAEIEQIARCETGALPSTDIPPGQEDRHARQANRHHDWNIDPDQLGGDRNGLGRNQAGKTQYDKDIVDTATQEVADCDVALVAYRRGDGGDEFGRRSADGDDRQADKGVGHLP